MSDLFVFDAGDSRKGVVSAISRDEYRLRMNSHFFVEQPTRPNAWFRFWQRVLLGWTWEKI